MKKKEKIKNFPRRFLSASRQPKPFSLCSVLFPLRGRNYTVQRVYVGKHEVLYVLTFYLPRFQDNTFREKMITVLHELYHISPHFDGDIRRFSGRYHAHSGSQKEYDRLMERYVDEYLQLGPKRELFRFLEPDFKGLSAAYGRVVGRKIPTPKLIPVPEDRRSA